MVKTVDIPRLHESDDFDIVSWVAGLHIEQSFHTDIIAACELAKDSVDIPGNLDFSWGAHTNCYHIGLDIAATVAGLQADHHTIIAAILYRLVREQRLTIQRVRQQFGKDVAKLVEGVSHMDAVTVSMDTKAGAILGQTQSQVDNLRRMLVTIIDDVRVVLLKLAERCSALRHLKPYPERAKKVAEEVSAVFAPLAHRLGIGHLKWELEDLSFRYINPHEYTRIAKLLDGKRLDRQRYIENVTEVLQNRMLDQGIHVDIQGRIKHIYSIWRKMQRKGIRFSEVYDIRALRILVNTLPECYAALGHVHSLWRNIPHEFDDYIANTKPNGYQSLHTAVIGPEGKVLEIQIRTHDMHVDAEFGVCAHWAYKGADNQPKDIDSYEQKIEWLRQVLDWQDELDGIDGLSSEVSEDRIYVFTPKGHVVDLPKGATPLDFAYHIHTEVGHRCRGAKVDGRIVPITYRLKTGQRIEILTAKEADPSRDWLRADLGYCQSNRTRSKIQQWFRLQNREVNLSVGRTLVEREFRRLDLTSIDYKKVATILHRNTVEDLYVAVGAGDITVNQVANAAEKIVKADESEQLDFSTFTPRAPSKQVSDIQVQGVGNLLTSTAACCKPVSGDDIVGYVTLGRGVSVHRSDCLQLLDLRAKEPQRIIAVAWGETDATYPVILAIEAYDRQGLLSDITRVMMDNSINVIGMNTQSDKTKNTASMHITIEVAGLDILSALVNRIYQLPNILSVSRVRNA